MRKRWIFLVPAVIVGILLLIAIGGEVVGLLWNWLLPPLFDWPRITFWQAVGLLALCRILFGSCGFHGSERSRIRRRLAERWEALTPEERERLRQKLRQGCGFGTSPSQPPGQ
jgi:hypothetical protein